MILWKFPSMGQSKFLRKPSYCITILCNRFHSREKIFPGHFGTEKNLNQHINAIR